MDSLAAECTETARQIRRDKAGALLCQLKWDGERGEYQDAGAAGTPGGDASTLDTTNSTRRIKRRSASIFYRKRYTWRILEAFDYNCGIQLARSDFDR